MHTPQAWASHWILSTSPCLNGEHSRSKTGPPSTGGGPQGGHPLAKRPSRLQTSRRLPESKQTDKMDQPNTHLSNRPGTRGQEKDSGHHWRRHRQRETHVSSAPRLELGPWWQRLGWTPPLPPCPHCPRCPSWASLLAPQLLSLLGAPPPAPHPLFLEETLTPHSPWGLCSCAYTLRMRRALRTPDSGGQAGPKGGKQRPGARRCLVLPGWGHSPPRMATWPPTHTHILH